jgi:hypothetical protein
MLGAVVAACGDSTGNDGVLACEGAVTVQVGSGTSPQISWTPVCRLFLVLVEDAGGMGGDQWAVESDSSNSIAPPVRYGTIPPGATDEITLPVTLQAGHAYRVNVFRFTGPGHEDGVLIGQANFTP